tara:strand:- start:185 stop:331 length:147 start_codon:yes stop_codon:yes gene_type:complete
MNTGPFYNQIFDGFSDRAKSQEVWEMVHQDWTIKDGFYWVPGQADLKG